MHRFYADPERSTPDTIVLTPEDARHALTVLRLKPGHHIEVILNQSRMEAMIVHAEQQNVSARILSLLPSTEPALSVTLFQGLPKSDKMDLIVQKATELGVTGIVPVLMHRCVVRPDHKDMERKTERWQKIAREAGKQAGRCIIPEVFTPVSIQNLGSLVPLPEIDLSDLEGRDQGGMLRHEAELPVFAARSDIVHVGADDNAVGSDDFKAKTFHGGFPYAFCWRLLYFSMAMSMLPTLNTSVSER